MGAGTWTSQNQAQPGVYIDFQSQNGVTPVPGARGTGTLALPLTWGPEGQVIVLQNGQDTTLPLGFPLTDPTMSPILEFCKGSSDTPSPATLLLWRLATTGGVQASATANGLTVMALYNGARTDLYYAIANDPDNSGKFVVTTYANGSAVDVQGNLATISNLTSNAYVAFTGTGTTALQVTAQTNLTGGSNGTIAPGAMAAYLTAISTYNFQSIGYPGTELYGPFAVTSITSVTTTATVTTAAPHGLSTGASVVIAGAVQTAYNGTYAITKTGASTFTYSFAGSSTSPATGTITFDPTAYIVGQNQAVFVQYLQSWVNTSGKYCQGILGGVIVSGNDTTASLADSEFITSILNGVQLSNGTAVPTALTAAQCVPWLTGASAGANYNQGLTYAQYPGAVDCNPRLNDTQINTAVAQGSLYFIPTGSGTAVQVGYDINTFTAFTNVKGKLFSKNRIIRTEAQLANDVQYAYTTYYGGKLNNNAKGQRAYAASLLTLLMDYQNAEAIQNVTPSDIVISYGTDTDAILVTLAVQYVDAIEKVYMTVNVQ